MSLRNERDSFGSCRGDARDAGELSAALLPPALPGEQRGPSPLALSPRGVPWAPMSQAAARSPRRPPRLRGCRRLSPVSQCCWGFTCSGGFGWEFTVSVHLAQQDRQWHSMPHPTGTGVLCSIPSSVLPAAPEVSSPQSPGPGGRYGQLSTNAEPWRVRAAPGRAVPGRHQPQHAWGPQWNSSARSGLGLHSPMHVGSILMARVTGTVPTSTGTAGSPLPQQDGTLRSCGAFQPWVTLTLSLPLSSLRSILVQGRILPAQSHRLPRPALECARAAGRGGSGGSACVPSPALASLPGSLGTRLTPAHPRHLL